jgi:hypothetical protein
MFRALCWAWTVVLTIDSFMDMAVVVPLKTEGRPDSAADRTERLSVTWPDHLGKVVEY